MKFIQHKGKVLHQVVCRNLNRLQHASNKIRDVSRTLVATFQDIEGNWLQLSEKKNNEK